MKRSKRTRLSKAKSSGTSRVGYGRPPAHTQFKRGQSGNPKGRPGSKARPKGLQENPGTLMLKILSEKLHLREGERVLSVSKLEALLRGAVAKAIKGDGRALEMILELFSEARELAGSSQ